MENKYIYDQVRSVPEDAKKPIKAGRLKGFTDISPMWRIEKLTDIFGPCGFGWWYEVTDRQIRECNGEACVFVDINLYVMHPESGEVSRGIHGTGGSKLIANERNGASACKGESNRA